METQAVLRYLKQTKNAVIGNPRAKLVLYQEVRYVNANTLFQPLESTFPEKDVTQIRVEAANILASLSRGPLHYVQGIIAANVPTALLTALQDLRPTDPECLRIALVRALRAVCVAVAESALTAYDIPEHDIEMRSEARAMLDYLFQEEPMAIYVPLLEDPSVGVRMLIAELLAFSVRVKKHRTTVTEWMPPEERSTRTKGKRGWEVPGLVDTKAPSRQGGWVIRHLINLLKSKESKVVEAALWAICALVEDNTDIAIVLTKSPSENKTQMISTLICSFSKDRNTNVRLAASQCATNIIRASPTNRSLSVTLLHVLTSILSGNEESDDNRIKACTILADLVRDDHNRCLDAYKSGSLIKVCDLIKDITPTVKPQEWEDGEAKGVLRLREAALNALASLTLLDNNIRTEVTDKLGMLPRISLCLTHPHAGTRLAACHCIRSLSRAVQVLRTAILDSGVSEILCKIVENREEDKRVTNIALAAMSNLVMNFSPLRKGIMERSFLLRIAELSQAHEDGLKQSALWTVKNLVNKATKEEKILIMSHIGWDQLLVFIRYPKDSIREQALNILCNITSNEEGIEIIFDHPSREEIIGAVADVLDSENEEYEVVCQAIHTLANISNGRVVHQTYIVSNVRLLSVIRDCMVHPMEEVRLAAVSCAEQLAHAHALQLREAEINVTLGRIVKNYVHGPVQSPSTSLTRSLSSGVESSQEVRERARAALRLIECGDDYSMSST
ncbi:ARM repeat-containing protein [Schizopora paradoxa]|uniref:ARM repeat-containing protein n=1 Tax=Schizopora paradoxa TaxID=27342 RepID=A0A0H2S3N8_9AGAM|nr:ARM repeat-containing protein [Schizopora paradoxa]